LSIFHNFHLYIRYDTCARELFHYHPIYHIVVSQAALVSPFLPTLLEISVSFLMYHRFFVPFGTAVSNYVHIYFFLINMNVGHKNHYVYLLHWYL